MLEDVEEDPAGKHRHPVRRQPVREDRRDGWADVIPTPVRPATSAASLAPSLGPFGQPGRPHCGAVPAGRAAAAPDARAAGSGPEDDVAGPALRPPSRGASCRRGGRRCDLSGRRASQRRQRRRRPARVVSQRRLAARAADARAGRTVPPPHPGLHIPAGDVGFWQGAIRDPGDPYPRSSSPRSQRTTDPPSTSSTATTKAASVPSLASPSHRSTTAICSHRRVTGTSISAIPAEIAARPPTATTADARVLSPPHEIPPQRAPIRCTGCRLGPHGAAILWRCRR